MFRTLLSAAVALTVFQSALAGDLSIPAKDEGLPGAGPVRRYDWFQKLWLEKRTAWGKQVEADQGGGGLSGGFHHPGVG